MEMSDRYSQFYQKYILLYSQRRVQDLFQKEQITFLLEYRIEDEGHQKNSILLIFIAPGA